MEKTSFFNDPLLAISSVMKEVEVMWEENFFKTSSMKRCLLLFVRRQSIAFSSPNMGFRSKCTESLFPIGTWQVFAASLPNTNQIRIATACFTMRFKISSPSMFANTLIFNPSQFTL